jgi:hypothetical protein
VDFHPFHVALNLGAKPVAADLIDGGRFDEIVFEHDSLHSEMSDGK